jgi:hypothetical protein
VGPGEKATPTLGELARQASRVHIYCEARGCHHSAPLRLGEVIARYGDDASSDVLRTGRVHLLEVGHQAFVAAKKMRPAGRLTLRRGIRVLREWLPKPL